MSDGALHDANYGPPAVLLRMTFILHGRGYEWLRLLPSISPSGQHWRLAIAPGWAFQAELGPIGRGAPSADYTTGMGWNFFDLGDAKGADPVDVANIFALNFADLVRASQGADAGYAAWLAGLVPRAERGELPYFTADWDVDCSRSVPMTSGGAYPLPPPFQKPAAPG